MNATAVAILTASSADQAFDELHQARRKDCLPIVVPTPERVDRMLLRAGGMNRDPVIGSVGPSGGLLIFELMIFNPVIPSCDPQIFPLIVTDCAALTDPVFEFGPLQNTTHPIEMRRDGWVKASSMRPSTR